MYIVDGKILTMAGAVYEDGVLHIRNGKIVEVGEKGSVELHPENGECVLPVAGA